MTTGLMKAIKVNNFGTPEVMFVTMVPIPEPDDNQIQIKVMAAGVNPVDAYIRSGTYVTQPLLPYTPGFDCAGIVTKLGRNITKFRLGERVFTVDSDTGTYAEYTLAKPQYTFYLDMHLSFEEGSALGIPYFTAYRSLFTKANAKPGETLLIHGATGAVGIALIQLAKMHGLIIIGTAGSNRGMNLIRSQGANYVYNHRDNNYLQQIRDQFPGGIEMVIEMMANVNLNNDISILRPLRGRIVLVGNRGTIEINPSSLMYRDANIMGMTIFNANIDEFESMNYHLQALISQKCIKPVIAEVFKLEEAPEAHHEITNKPAGTFGRFSIKMD